MVTDGQRLAVGDLDGGIVAFSNNAPAPKVMLSPDVDDTGNLALVTADYGQSAPDFRMELYDIRRMTILRTWKLDGRDPGDHIEFNPHSKRFQFTSKMGTHQIVFELTPEGDWLPIGNIPSVDIFISLPVKGGTLLQTFEDTKAATYVIRPDGSEQIVTRKYASLDVSDKGDVVYLEGTGSLTRIMFLRSSSNTPQLVGASSDAAWPTISPDSQTIVYFRFPAGEIFQCSVPRSGSNAACELVHTDPEMLPGTQGRVGPDGTSIPYLSIDGGRWLGFRNVRVFSLRSRKVRDIGRMDAECTPRWASHDSLWVLVKGATEWEEFHATSGRRLGRKWPADPATRCWEPPPSVQPVRYGIRRERPWDVRFAPDGAP